MLARAALVLALAAPLGCSGKADGRVEDAGPGTDAAGDLDLSRASWTVAPVDDGAGSVSFDPDVVVTDAGEAVFGWINLIAADQSYQLFSAGGDARTIEPRSDVSTDATLRRTQLETVADRVHLVVAGGPRGTSEDVFYAGRAAGTWGPLTDVTSAADPDDLAKTLPIPVDVNGRVFLTFLARDPAAGGSGVYAVRFADPANPDPMETILDKADYACVGLHALVDGGGSIHLAATCSVMGGPRQLLYGNDKGGDFAFQTADLGASTVPREFDLALGPDGRVHLVWVGTVDCGGASCADVLYSRDLGPPISVTNDPQEGGRRPRLAVDRQGRAIVVYHRENTDEADLLWTYRDGNGFVRSQQVLPTEPGIKHWLDGGLAIDPRTGSVHTVFVRTDAAATPANADVLEGVLR